MDMKFSEKAEQLDAGIFAVLNEKKNELVKQGRTIYNLSVGTPDFPPMPHIMEAVSEAAKRPENYKYALSELPELLDAVQSFYQKRFGVQLEADEIMTMYGSQEGMAHIAWALCNPGELVLVPNPGYQIFSAGPRLCDAEVWEYPFWALSATLSSRASSAVWASRIPATLSRATAECSIVAIRLSSAASPRSCF